MVKENQDKPLCFGVKSYLHHFYEQVSFGDTYYCDDEEDNESRYLIPPRETRYTIKIWRFAFWLGLIILIIGSMILLLSHLYPKQPMIIDQKEEMEIIDPKAIKINHILYMGKLVGLGVFTVGGSILSITLLLMGIWGSSEEEESSPFKVKCVDILDDRVPVVTNITNVQPR